MGSITESVESGRSNAGRCSSFHTHLQCWNNKSSNGELSPQLQKIGTHMTRTPALDLAQQAQLAACTYLGYSPRDLPNAIFHPQGPDRPLELHMHHYHHHYVAPTSPFSQTSSQCHEGSVNEFPGAVTTQLAIRVGSPLPTLPSPNSTAIYPALALGGSPLLPQLIHNCHGHVQTPSRYLQDATSMGDVEAAQRYMQNILWLKNQIDHSPDQEVNQWQERTRKNAVGSETRITRRDSRSADLGYSHPLSSEQHPIRHEKTFTPPQAGYDSKDSNSVEEDLCQRECTLRTKSDSALLLEKCEKMRAFRTNNSPCDTQSVNNSLTDNSACSVSLSPMKHKRSPTICLKSQKKKLTGKGEKPSTIEPLTQQICRSHGLARPEGSLLCPSWTRGRDLKSHKVSTPCDNMASSLDNDSICSSGGVSVHRGTQGGTWTYTNSSTESDTQPNEWSPCGKSARKRCGGRPSHRKASRDTTTWDTIESKPQKISCHTNTRPEASVQPVCMYEMDFESKIVEQGLGDIHNSAHHNKSHLQDTHMEEKERGDKNKSQMQRSESHFHLQVEVEPSNKTIVTDHMEKAWTPSLGSNRGLGHVPIDDDIIGTNETQCERLQDESHHWFFPRMADNQIGDCPSNNKLREAVEAAWNTNLGANMGLGDYCALSSSDHRCTDQVTRDKNFHGDLKEIPVHTFSIEGRAHSCPWKVRLGMKKGIEEDCIKKSPTDSIFQNIHRDHNDLRALVAREESLQRELKDQTVARVAAEERARVAAEEKAHMYEASAKAAEEGLRVLLDERTLFQCKFKEELEKGAIDRLRLQELLHLEKLKLESTESELRELRRHFQDSLAVGTRALPSKNILQCPRLDSPCMNIVQPQGLGEGHDEAHLKLMVESECRIAAKAKASHFEASAKATEERLHSLLEERNWFYSRFKEELKQNNTDMKKLQQLMELEKCNNGNPNPQHIKRVDVKPLVDSTLTNKNLYIETEDSQGALHNGARFETPICSKQEEELVPEGERLKLGPLLEFKGHPNEQSQLYCTCDREIFGFKQAKDFFAEDQKSVPSLNLYENNDIQYVRADYTKLSMKNEKKRPLSPMNGSRVRHWKSTNTPLSVEVERCHGKDGETATILDISPVDNRLDSIDLHFRENPKSHDDCSLTRDDSLDFKENALHFRNSSALAERSHANGGPTMALPSKWKKETKAELRRMIQEQEMTWKIAEDAVEELGRRLELLERYKMEIQDTLGKTKAMGSIDHFLKKLQGSLVDCPRGFDSLYNSPIYEDGKLFYNCPHFMKKKGERATCQDVCTSPTRLDISKDSEIEKLKIEVAQLRIELQQRDNKKPNNRNLKNTFDFSPSSPPSPRLPTSQSLEADTDWSAHLLLGFETPLEKEVISPLHLISQGNPTTPEVTAEKMKSELANDSFWERRTIMIHAIPNDSKQYPNGKVDKFEPNDELSFRTLKLDLDNRMVPIPNKCQDKSVAPMCMENGTCQIEEMDYRERVAPQEDMFLSIDLNSNKGELGILKTTVHKLSCMFWEQEEKLKNFKHRDKKEGANNFQAKDIRGLYLDMLKEMSQQLGELCHDLHTKTQSNEVLDKQERTIQKCDPMQKLVQKFQHTEMVDSPIATSKGVQIAQQAPIEDEDTTLFSADKCGARQIFKEEDQPENVILENLRTSLQVAEKKIEEQINTNLLLKEKLESGSQYLLKMQAGHAQEIGRKDNSINYAQCLNLDLTNDMSQTKMSLAEIRLRYKSLMSNLEQQLEEAKAQARSLHDKVNTLKEDIVLKENLISNLETEAKEHELQIEQLRSQIEAIQNDNIENVREKLGLINTLEAMRSEVDEQQHRVRELISINEDLIQFSESKEDEITRLKRTIKSMQQCFNEKSAQAAKLSAETLAFSQEVAKTKKEGEAYHLHCNALTSKLEEIEHELLAREASMERLTQHLGKTIEGQDFILEEKEQLLLSLNRAQYKEHRLDDQVRQSKIIIQDLEEKLSSMDTEINQARFEMAEMEAKGLEALRIEQQAGEMRKQVHKLEEEIMEKEGQISILKTSYPGEYTSTF